MSFSLVALTLYIRGCKKEALEFQRWVYHEVLPSIRKHGYYSVAPVVAKPTKTKNPKRVAGQFTPASVYVAHMKDNFNVVKIGHSHAPEGRLPQIKGLNRKDFYKTVLLPRKVARLFEQVCYEIFAPYALGNELFGIEYDEACRIIRALEKFADSLSRACNFEHDDKALTIAKNLLVEAANTIADKQD